MHTYNCLRLSSGAKHKASTELILLLARVLQLEGEESKTFSCAFLCITSESCQQSQRFSVHATMGGGAGIATHRLTSRGRSDKSFLSIRLIPWPLRSLQR